MPSGSNWSAESARDALFAGGRPSRASGMGRQDAEQQQALLEQQNDTRMEDMAGRSSALHRITVDIHSEVERQNAFLGESDGAFSTFGDRLQHTSRRLRVMSQSRHNQRTCRYAAIAVVVFFLFYYGYRWMGPSSPVIQVVHDAM